jgi:tetratricopeptide (TPR) repeat protein
MPSERIDALRQMLTLDPNNTFVRYGLAMELAKTEADKDASVAEFRALMEINPDYAASYFHCGKVLESMDRLDEAREVMERGIEVTRRTGDRHTMSELQGALDLLGL